MLAFAIIVLHAIAFAAGFAAGFGLPATGSIVFGCTVAVAVALIVFTSGDKPDLALPETVLPSWVEAVHDAPPVAEPVKSDLSDLDEVRAVPKKRRKAPPRAKSLKPKRKP